MYGSTPELEYEQEDYIAEFTHGGGELEGETGLGEAEVTALAHELLGVQSEDELEQFLGNLLKGAAKAVGGFIKSPVGQALGNTLKGVAKAALPTVGGALGSMIAPGIGTAIGGQLGSMASNLFEYEDELTSLPAHEQELEVARRVVRLSVGAGRSAARARPGAPTRQVVSRAMRVSARRNAPGLLRSPSRGSRRRGGPASGGYPGPGGYGGPRGYWGWPGPYGGWPAPPVGPWYGDDEGDGDDGDEESEQFYRYTDSDSYDDRPSSPYGVRARSGRWIRRGRRYILLGT
jgi:uncharacterized protein (DUF697 family)